MKLLSLIKEKIIFSRFLPFTIMMALIVLIIYQIVDKVVYGNFYSLETKYTFVLFIVLVYVIGFFTFLILMFYDDNVFLKKLECQIKEYFEKNFEKDIPHNFKFYIFPFYSFALIKCSIDYKRGKINKKLIRKTKEYYIDVYKKIFKKIFKKIKRKDIADCKLFRKQRIISKLLKRQ